MPSIISDSESATEEFGIQLGNRLTSGSVVALYGDLGAGKTTLSRGIARGLGITEPIISPTYTLIQDYDAGDCRLYHIDLYRINNEMEAISFGIEQFLGREHTITLIEWAERIESLLDMDVIEIRIEHKDLNSREIYFDLI